MNKKNLIFILSIFAVIIVLNIYDSHKMSKTVKEIESEKESIQTSHSENGGNGPYAAFKRNVFGTDNYPDMMAEVGDNVQIRYGMDTDWNGGGELIMTVNSAKLLDEAKSEDYENELFQNELLFYTQKENMCEYEEELRYLYVDITMKSMSQETKTINFNSFSHINENRFGSNEYGSSMSFDYVKVIEGDLVTIIEDKEWVGRVFELEPDKEYHVVCVNIITPGSVYDLYFTTNTSDYNTPNDQVAVRLNIAEYETMECDPSDGVVSEYQKRDLKQLRINAKHTSYSFFEEQSEGFEFLDSYFHKFGSTVGKPWEQAEGEVIPGMRTTILDAYMVDDMEELPDNFEDSKYLKQMLDVYLEQLPYDKEEYRYLYMKANFEELGNLGITTQINNYLWLYNRDDDNNLWVFGCADDYYILSSTNKQQTVEYQEIQMEQGEEIVVEAVYIVVPDTVYDLYWYTENNGLVNGDRTYESDTYGAISLGIKEYEQGGIK